MDYETPDMLVRVQDQVTIVRLRRGIVAVVSRRSVRELVVFDPHAIRGWRALRAFIRRANA